MSKPLSQQTLRIKGGFLWYDGTRASLEQGAVSLRSKRRQLNVGSFRAVSAFLSEILLVEREMTSRPRAVLHSRGYRSRNVEEHAINSGG